MREIKFRAWHKRNQYMYFLTGFSFYGEGWKGGNPEYKFIELQFEGGFMKLDIREIELMQFVGLPDKDGKQIYEGDICKGPNRDYWIIEWQGHSWCMRNKIIRNGLMKFGIEFFTIDLWVMLPPRKQSLEIIGNIYEHPDLLK